MAVDVRVRSEQRPGYGAESERPAGGMVEYRCRRCRRWLFSSDATYGRLRMPCPNRECRTEQMVFLGGPQPPGDGG